MAAITFTYRVLDVLYAEQYALFSKVFNDKITSLKTVKPSIFTCVCCHNALSVYNLNLFKVVPLSHEEVVRVVSRCNFDTA